MQKRSNFRTCSRERLPKEIQSQFNEQELQLLESLRTPQQIQDFLDRLPPNFEPNGDECRSARHVLQTQSAHCIEAAMFAAMVLRMQGRAPLLVDLTANTKDDDHVLAVFKQNNCWGAIAKSNHYCNGYRDPIYKSLRELAMSYFHEYLNYAGEKTLRSYAGPFNLTRLDKDQWMTSEKNVWTVPGALMKLPHHRLLTRHQETLLRPADEFLRRVNNIPRYHPKTSKPFMPRHGAQRDKGSSNM